MEETKKVKEEEKKKVRREELKKEKDTGRNGRTKLMRLDGQGRTQRRKKRCPNI